MYNSFVEMKRSREHDLESHRHQTQRDWEKRHNCTLQHYEEFRSRLIKKYEKRVENFIYRMEENPIEMKTGDRVEVDLRDDSDSKNIITQKHFRLKDPTDWKSIFTSHERMEMDRHRKKYETLLNRRDQLVHRSVASQSAYEPEHIDKYRTREKDKEIQKNPMRFSYVPKKIAKRVQSVVSADTEDDENDSKRHTNSNESGDQDNFSVGSKISKKQITATNVNVSMESQKARRKLSKASKNSKNSKEKRSKKSKDSKRKKMMTEAEQEKEPQDPSKIKFHFKAVMDILVKDKAMSKAAKDILRRCRLVKFKKIEQEAERDLFQLNNKE